MSSPMAAAVICDTIPCAPVFTHLVCSLPTLPVPLPALRGDSEKIEILVWPLVVALAYCLYAPELDIQ